MHQSWNDLFNITQHERAKDMDSTIISPTPGSGATVVGNGEHRGHDHLWDHAILQDTRAESRHLMDRQFDINKQVLESELRNKERIQELERRLETRHGELRVEMVTKFHEVTDLMKDQKIQELRDRLNNRAPQD